MALFITFEGVEGCGKSTQARALYRRLKKEGVEVLLTHEPGGTHLGARVRRFLKKEKNADIKDEAELFLFLASRAQLVREIIRPNIEKGITVICDRYAESTLAYQGYAIGLSLPFIETANGVATGGIHPDIIILLDIEPGLALRRKLQLQPDSQYDRFDTRDFAFHRKVREGYLQMAIKEPERWAVVDGSKSRKEIEQAIWEVVWTQIRNTKS